MKFKTQTLKDLSTVSMAVSALMVILSTAMMDETGILLGATGVVANLFFQKVSMKGINTEYCEAGLLSVKLKEVK